ncbi:GntR family transcriptional regulator [Mycetocola reblochoni]|uniref:Transcriptional regulator, GntR family n=2 Tax=Mycetocola reblochoni TaxID=331618 RepID=A0A1R4K9V1_9MICO|nr:GntR family transcriptional regulator [Mycetocola reblochoni]RLP71167.1 GntR family transcriptional regulator [Mycetocola reblochoni]SJN41018.1 Transcriptional regulator, GntR family [Mycetocola reblochoni REB411]
MTTTPASVPPVPRREPAVVEIDRKALRDHVSELILELLLRGEFAPGERLGIENLARRINVSPTPVREALVQLERTKLITREALKGYRVAPPLDATQMSQLSAARLMLETEAVRLATPLGAEGVERLRAAQRRHAEAGAGIIERGEAAIGDAELTGHYFACDTAFHRVFIESCGNPFIVEMTDALGAQLHRMRQTVSHGVTDVAEAIAEHAAMAEAIASGDPDAASAAVRAHLLRVQDRALRAAGPLGSPGPPSCTH